MHLALWDVKTVCQSLLDSQYLLHEGKLRNKREREKEREWPDWQTLSRKTQWPPDAEKLGTRKRPICLLFRDKKSGGQFLSYPHPFCREKEVSTLFVPHPFRQIPCPPKNIFLFFLFKNLATVTAAQITGVILALKCRLHGPCMQAAAISKETSFAGYSVLTRGFGELIFTVSVVGGGWGGKKSCSFSPLFPVGICLLLYPGIMERDETWSGFVHSPTLSPSRHAGLFLNLQNRWLLISFKDPRIDIFQPPLLTDVSA